MRKILFRIKNRDDWYYGYPMSEIKNNTVAFIGDKKLGSDYYDLFADVTSLGQFTGLYDRKGKMIFEGDIVRYVRKEVREPSASWNGQDLISKHLIYWNEERHCFYQDHYTEERCIGSGGVGFTDTRAKENIIEVIGNIYDNPELLEVRNAQ